MKILFFIDTLIAGGKERRFTELLKGIKQIPDVEFEIVVMNENIYYEEIFNLKVKIHYLIRKSKYDLSVLKKFYTISKEYKPDIIHCWAALTTLIAIPTCKLLNIKLVNGMVIDTPVNRNISNKYWLQAKLSFPFSNMIIGNSNAGLKAYGAPSKRSLCIYNGMDFNRFKDLKSPLVLKKEIFGCASRPDYIIGMVARFEARKDYATLIKAAISLVKSNNTIFFVLIGEGTELEKMKEMVPLNFKKNIIFPGGRSDVESIINLFDIGILLTNTDVHGEGISNSIIEYMALAKPVIATAGGGTIEVIEENVNGYLIDNGNTTHLITNIEKLIENYELRNQFGKAGLQLVKRKFDSKIMTQNYISMYINLLQKT